ncbi:Salicylate 1-monooxygenase [Sulfitobacter noctilucae]|uniref:FAD-dependent monooxygenase n=1 Tax=Sulfitobacter noctilucae TaxID=1342302 RepID=UPI000A7DF9DD|nr:FAD-dependent monooxygenase [Sulfitobacter noctilucae]KIN60452.1 Salicylate 1-monooxygenase [Sulfitobacter noctilucae]
MKDIRIIIVGAGIGGLAAGLALQRRGFKVALYERAAEIRDIGAGVIITANARKALHNLGVDEKLAEISSCVDAMKTCKYDTGEAYRVVSNSDIFEKYGMKTLQVHRADLHRLLMEAVKANDPEALHAGHQFIELEQDDTGVEVRFQNGAVDRGDILIGADGNASAIRSQLFPGEATSFNGQVAFRALIPSELVPQKVLDVEYAMHPGPKRYLMHYPLRGGSIMNLIGCGQSDTWQEEGWAIPAQNDEFYAAYSDFAPHLKELITKIPEGNLFKWGLRDREPLDTWTSGRVSMLGDAAHPMTPFLGQGACLALEDALLVGRAFEASSDPLEALARYEAARKERGNGVQLLSRQEGQSLQTPKKVQKPAIDRGLLAYDPVTVAV